MKTYALTFDGSGTDEKVLPQGTYVRILETSTPISIVAEGGGVVLADLQSVQQGLAWESEGKGKNLVPFTRVRVTSAAAQTVKLAVGYGRVLNDATSGNIAVTNAGGAAAVNVQDGGNSLTVDDGAGSLTVDDGAGSLTVDGSVSETPAQLDSGGWWTDVSATTTLFTIVTPASNVDGVIIYGAFAGAVTAGLKARIMAKSSAPSSMDDNAAGTLAYAEGGRTLQNNIRYPIKLAPGLGLYAQSNETVSYRVMSILLKVL